MKPASELESNIRMDRVLAAIKYPIDPTTCFVHAHSKMSFDGRPCHLVTLQKDRLIPQHL